MSSSIGARRAKGPSRASISGLLVAVALAAPIASCLTRDKGGGATAPDSAGDVNVHLPHGIPDPHHFDDSLCYYFCHWAAHCHDIDAFGTQSGCQATCTGMLSRGLVNNVACYASKCSARDSCLQAEPLATPAACAELCRNASACKGLMVLGLPADPAACTTMCAGMAYAYPSYADALPCLVQKAPSCDVEGALACLSNGESLCGPLCEELSGCKDKPFGNSFADKAACYSMCAAGRPADAYRARRCFDILECAADMTCMKGPTPASCESYADFAMAQCGGAEWPPARELVARECALSLVVDGLPPNPDPAACARGGSICPRLDFGRNPPPCSVKAPGECEFLCNVFEGCGIMDRPRCLASCVGDFWLFRRQQIPDLIQCLTMASCDWAAIDRCFQIGTPPGHGAPFCGRFCAVKSICDPSAGGDSSTCKIDCEQGLQRGETKEVSALSCSGEQDCGGLLRCLAAPEAPMDPACAQICSGVLGTCHHISISYDTGFHACAAVCSDWLHRHGRTGDAAAAQCIIGKTDHDCRVQGGESCF